MDADIIQVYRRLAIQRYAVNIVNTAAKQPIRSNFLPDLCTAEMTTFLKETTTHGN